MKLMKTSVVKNKITKNSLYDSYNFDYKLELSIGYSFSYTEENLPIIMMNFLNIEELYLENIILMMFLL